jgi:AcrR family transcriptional regulator
MLTLAVGERSHSLWQRARIELRMAEKRLRKEVRRASILEAATRVFAEFGRDGAKTLMIASEAKVSEALIFRHFPSKDALYSAVLRKLVRDQDESFAAIGEMTADSAGIVRMLCAYFNGCIRGTSKPSAQNIRILFASLAGDQNYARFAYRRALKLSLPFLQEALKGARLAGELVGEPLDPVNLVAFIEHLGSTLCVARVGERPTVQYGGDEKALLRDVVLFAGRGLGLKEEVVERHLHIFGSTAPTAKVVLKKRKSPTRQKAST